MLPEKPKQEQAIINKKDKIGKAANHSHVKQLMNTKPARAIKKVIRMDL